MNIKLNQFIPSPLSETYSGSSELWKQSGLNLNQQTTTLITSPSGKGKSSLISMIYGLRNDFEGTILIDNKPITEINTKQWSDLRSRKIAVVFQSLKLFDELTAYENILIKNQLTNHKTENEIQEFISILGMTPFMKQPAGTLSFGQQQRIAIIRALCQPFELILLDEPFSHLDKENALTAWDLIKTESKMQNANIIITGLGSDDFLNPDKQLSI